jgi:hypothetical protein
MLMLMLNSILRMHGERQSIITLIAASASQRLGSEKIDLQLQ